MKIQWFPGHMTKSLRDMQTALKAIDFVVYVLDARAPKACINPEFDKLFLGLPVLYVLNKADIVPAQSLEKATAWLLADKVKDGLGHSKKGVVSLNSVQTGSTKIVAQKARQLCKDKIDKYKQKGAKVSLCGIVVGVPNVGKSTLINNLLGKRRLVVGDRPGVTRAIQSVKIDEYLEVRDSPGTLYPKFESELVATQLAILGSIRDAVLDTTEVSQELLHFLCRDHLDVLTERYKIVDTDTFETCLEKIGKKRGYLQKGGVVDLDKAASAILDDFRKGALGKISLED